MRYEKFKALYDKLNDYSDVKKLAEETGLDEEFLNVIYTQKTVRAATKRYHVIRRNAPRLLREWRKGSSFLSLAQQWNFPPILIGLILFQENGYSKKQFWKHVHDPNSIKDPRLRKEIIEITAADTIYSPEGNEIQHKRGIWGEEKLQEWLEEQELTYQDEDELRGKYSKTPDCLLDEPIKINGQTIHWIESKASFGDRIEFNRNIRSQLAQYVEMFGPGMVVYWFGHLDNLDCPPGIEIIDASLSKIDCQKADVDFCPEELPSS
ncbi:MAG: TPD domain-containing protein, partial [Euryarchaeota archaeon]|nr:TPD domain-containing protein [Euryarchaeota archaeon]